MLTGFVWPRVKTSGEFLEYNNEIPNAEIILNYIKTDVKEICWQGVDRMDVAQSRDKLQGFRECAYELSGFVKYREFTEYLSNDLLFNPYRTNVENRVSS